MLSLVWADDTISAEVPVSEATQECIECHASIHPGIVSGWRSSRHAKIVPADAAAVKGLARKVSSKTIPERLQKVAVGCAECHTLRPKAHADTFSHSGYKVHVVVSPDDCATCHSQERAQYSKNLMAHAYQNLVGNPVYATLQRDIIGKIHLSGEKLQFKKPAVETENQACLYCHGTRLKVTGSEVRETELAGKMKFPTISGWPNQGVGRVNLDGSLGACSACHTRHTFSIEMARKPHTCKECHVGPDVPIYKVYDASKHGNIYSALGGGWNYGTVPWRIGKDFTSPTCAACHVSLLVDSDGEPVVKRTHQMNNRLPWRLFGLIYAHPHPIEPDTARIRNRDGLPLPTDFEGGLASKYLIGADQIKARTTTMQKVCLSCHGTAWVKGFWRGFEHTIQETNAQTLTGTRIMRRIWKSGLARGLDRGASPFDEAIERKWQLIWLFYGNSIRFTAAMAGGGDYGVFANGRFQLSQRISELNDWLTLRSRLPARLAKEKK
jgi:hypothetical protein